MQQENSRLGIEGQLAYYCSVILGTPHGDRHWFIVFFGGKES